MEDVIRWTWACSRLRFWRSRSGCLWSTVKIVPQGYNYTVENFGRYTRTLQPGMHILVPVMERVGHQMNMKEQVMDIPSQDVITRDNAMVRVDGVAVLPDPQRRASRLRSRCSSSTSIINLTMTNIRTVMGSMDLDELLSNRDQINARLLHVVDAATEAWGVKVTRIEIKDIAPPRDLVDSMARQMKAEREKRAQILESEGLRQAAILKGRRRESRPWCWKPKAAKKPPSATPKPASASPKPKPRRPAGVRGHRRRQRAGHQLLRRQQLREGAARLWPSAPNQKVIMMPLEASSVIGSLGGSCADHGRGVRWRQARRRRSAQAAAPAHAACRAPELVRTSVCRHGRASEAETSWTRSPTSSRTTARGSGSPPRLPCWCSKRSCPACISSGSVLRPVSWGRWRWRHRWLGQWQLILFALISIASVFARAPLRAAREHTDRRAGAQHPRRAVHRAAG